MLLVNAAHSCLFHLDSFLFHLALPIDASMSRVLKAIQLQDGLPPIKDITAEGAGRLTLVLYETIDNAGSPLEWLRYLTEAINAGIGRDLRVYIIEERAAGQWSPLLTAALGFYTRICSDPKQLLSISQIY